MSKKYPSTKVAQPRGAVDNTPLSNNPVADRPATVERIVRLPSRKQRRKMKQILRQR